MTPEFVEPALYGWKLRGEALLIPNVILAVGLSQRRRAGRSLAILNRRIQPMSFLQKTIRELYAHESVSAPSICEAAL